MARQARRFFHTSLGGAAPVAQGGSEGDTQRPSRRAIQPPQKVSTRLPQRHWLEAQGEVESNNATLNLSPERAPQSLLGAEPAPGAPERGTDRYQVREEVGRGGMGKVLRVEDVDLNREVAMKVLLMGRVDQEQVGRFIEEAQISSQLEHPNMLPVHDFGVNKDGQLFFTMKYVRGHQDLASIIDLLRDGDQETFARYTFERRVQIVQLVCHALQYAHERGVVHRDIKPSNIVVGEHGEVYLVDWGVAKVVAPDVERKVKSTGRLQHTEKGTWLGTPAYMAPEQVLGRSEEVDARTDVYAVCAVLYELLTLNYYLGAVGEEMTDLVAAIINKQPPDAEDWVDPQNGRVPRPLSRILRAGLKKRKADRFQSARELEEALQAWLEGNAPIVCPGTAIQRGLSGYIRWIDLHPVLLPALTITGAVLLLGWLVTATVLALRGP